MHNGMEAIGMQFWYKC